jgi:exodeoxyribonuclease-3
MRIVTFNVNGIRSIARKNNDGEIRKEADEVGICQMLQKWNVDILCLQEIKTQSAEDIEFLRELLPYGDINCCSRKKGYSGVAIMCRIEPEWISYGFDLFHEERIGLYQGWDIEREGRLICAKFEGVIVVTVYVPNAQAGLARIQERMRWDALLRAYLRELRVEFGLPVILCGDMNVAPEDRDIHRKQPKQTPGCSIQERGGLQAYHADGWIDAFRFLYPDAVGPDTYTWWSNFSSARDRGKGWRIDLFLVSGDLMELIREVRVLREYRGSDHGAVLLEVEI